MTYCHFTEAHTTPLRLTAQPVNICSIEFFFAFETYRARSKALQPLATNRWGAGIEHIIYKVDEISNVDIT